MNYQIYRAKRWPDRLGPYCSVGPKGRFSNKDSAEAFCGDLNSDNYLSRHYHYEVRAEND